MFASKQLSLSIVMTACLWGATAPTASAAPVTIPVGAIVSIVDPAGSGRTVPALFSSGTSKLTFSTGAEFDGIDETTLNGGLGALNVANLRLTPGAGATVVETSIVGVFGDTVRVGASVSNNLSSAAIDPLTGTLSTLSANGSLTLSGTRIKGVLDGGSATLSNIRFDLENKRVVADLDGVRGAFGTTPATAFSARDTTMWTFASITGPTTLPPATLLAANANIGLSQMGYTVARTFETTGQIIGYAPGSCSGSYGGYGYSYGGGGCYNPAPVPIYDSSFGVEVTGQTRLEGLQLTQGGLDFLSQSLGLKPVAASAFLAVTDYGSVTLTTNYVLGVPEPGTYALMALGLGLMVGAVRRNQRFAA